MKNIYQALLTAQKEIKAAAKDSVNPHFKANYASLESVLDAIKEPLNKHGILITHWVENLDDKSYIRTSLVHADSAESISSVSEIINLKKDMQGLGSAISYSKRYNLAALTSLATEDDDGNSASKKPQEKSHAHVNVINNQAPVSYVKPDPKGYALKAGKMKGVVVSEMNDADVVNYVKYIEKLTDVKGILLDDYNALKKHIETKNIIPF
jgi:hypothetical protein